VLTGDHLFDTLVHRPLGLDPFAWHEDDEESDAQRAEQWKPRLVELVTYLSEDHDPDSSLFLDV
jgi:hypothetical protein